MQMRIKGTTSSRGYTIVRMGSTLARLRRCFNSLILSTSCIALITLFSLYSISAHALYSTPGQFSVGPDGSASYNIPIQVPPGTSGMSPKLSLNYSSNGNNGILGMGWGIDGLSQITRCPTTLAQDGVINGVNYTSTDRYCIDGQRLIATTDSYVTNPNDSTKKIYTSTAAYGGNGTEYRTEQANFAKIISYGSAGNGPAWFKVWTKGGQIIEYGNTTDARIEAAGIATVRSWGVNKISDTKGNYITVTYTEDNPNGEAYVQRIDYTGNPTSTPVLTPYANVQFIYETRPDISTGYQAGSILKSTKRMTDIKTYNGTTLIKDYKLTYEQSTATQRSRLKTLTECDGNSTTQTCQQATVMGWKIGNGVFTGWQAIGPYSTAGTFDLSNCKLLQMADINGDGLADEVCNYSYGTYEVSFVKKNQGNGVFTGWQAIGPYSAAGTFNLSNCLLLQMSDINGDGLPDEVCNYTYNNGGTYEVSFVKQNQGNGVFTGWQAIGPYSTAGTFDLSNCKLLQMADINGDGLADEVCNYSYGTYEVSFVKKNQGNGVFTGWQAIGPYSAAGTFNLSNCLLLQMSDINGDGLPDEVCNYSYGTYEVSFVKKNQGNGVFTGWQAIGPYSAAGTFNLSNCLLLQMSDINGDGLPDEVCNYSYGTYEVSFVKKNQGNGVFTGWQAIGPYSAAGTFNLSNCLLLQMSDINGDGLPDEVCNYTYNNGGTYEVSFVKQNQGNGVFTGWQAIGPYSTAGTFDLSNCKLLQMADINGDGLADEVCNYTYNNGGTYEVSFVKQNSYIPDLLTTLTPGLLPTISVTYKPITDSSVYIKDSGSNAAVYPIQDLQVPAYVVSSYTQSDGIGGVVTTNYNYGGLKADLSGRGSLGFRYVKESSPDSGIGITSFYRQDYPYAGLPSQSEKRLLSNNTLLGAGQYTYANTDLTIGTGSAISKFPYVSQSVEQSYELDGSLVTSTTTANQYDTYGNVTQVTVTGSDGYIKSTANYYSNDSTNWLLGRLTRATVTSTTPTSTAPSTPVPTQWVKCADENQYCNFTGTTTVRFGANGQYSSGTFTNNVVCNTSAFTDPIYGVAKTCEISMPMTAPTHWVRCAGENQYCNFTGTSTVRFGANGQYSMGTFTNSVACNTGSFTDPINGVAKSCDVYQ